MPPLLKAFLLLVALTIVIGVIVGSFVLKRGVSARGQPGTMETFLARRARALAIPGSARDIRNPVERAPEIIAEGRAHFADHCALCHANDGSGTTVIGKGMLPKPPDLRLPDTQNLTDGELFYIIENGIRFTGMPGWGTGTADGELASWHLVHFIRHLPDVSKPELAEMARLNPKSPAEMRQQIEEEMFLRGERATPPAKPATPHRH